MVKEIDGFTGYFISDDGKVYCNLGKGNRRNGHTVDLYEIIYSFFHICIELL